MGQREQASTPINQEALRLIREGMAASGLTQSQLAEATALPRSTLANILSPTAKLRLVHVEQLIKIAVAVGVDPRTWVRELEAVERRLNPQPRRPAAQVQRRAARGRSKESD